MKLQYKAANKEGKIIQGVIEAKDEKEAVSYLRSKNFFPIRITKQSNASVSKLFPFVNKSSRQLLFLTQQLASMLTSELTILQAFNILKDQASNVYIKDVVSGIVADLEEGKSLSVAIAKYPDFFPPVYISSVKAGEQAGLLDKVLTRLADNLEKSEKLKSSIKAALFYPVIILIGMVSVMIIVMIFLIPQLLEYSKSAGSSIPFSTKILIVVYHILVNFWWLMVVGFFLGLIAFRRWYKTESGRLIVDSWILQVPIFGKLLKNSILTEFTRILGLLIGSGTLVVDALRQSADATDNIIYKNAITGIAGRVEKGITISDAMLSYSLFPTILIQMVKIGEQTGKLDESLTKISQYFERELDQAVKALTAAIEPLVLVILGIGTAFLVFSIITPIYNLSSSLLK